MMIHIEYTPENVKKVGDILRGVFDETLLPKRKWYNERYRERKYFGLCYMASAVMQDLFGKENMYMIRAEDPHGFFHWWNQTRDGNRIDLTHEQYTTIGETPPYADGKKMGQFGFSSYKKQKERLYARAEEKLRSEFGVSSDNLLDHIS